MMSDKGDPVIKILNLLKHHLPPDQVFDEERKLVSKAIAIQKAQARVIHEVRGFVLGQWASTGTIERELAALDELTKEGK